MAYAILTQFLSHLRGQSFSRCGSVWTGPLAPNSVCRHDTIWDTYGPTNSQAAPRLIHRASRAGVRVVRLSWGGKRTVSPRRGRDRLVVHSGHSTLATPASRMAVGNSARRPINAHLFAGVALMVAPTGSRAGARSIRCLGLVGFDGVFDEGSRGGSGGAGGSRTLLVAAREAASCPRVEVPSNACNCWWLCALPSSTLRSPVRASISKRTRWPTASAWSCRASTVKRGSPSV
jgi:hypothetical protein